METLQKWGDAYAALLVSATLIVVALISTMMMDLPDSMVILLVGTMFGVTSIGVFIIYKTAPQEIKAYKNRKGPEERRRAILAFYVLAPLGFFGFLYMGQTSGLGIGFLMLGISLAPSAYYGFRDDGRVTRIDQELPNFIRALGNVSGALGVTLSASIGKIDRRAMEATLEPTSKSFRPA